MNTGFSKFEQWARNRFAGEPASNNCEVINDLVEAERRSETSE